MRRAIRKFRITELSGNPGGLKGVRDEMRWAPDKVLAVSRSPEVRAFIVEENNEAVFLWPIVVEVGENRTAIAGGFGNGLQH